MTELRIWAGNETAGHSTMPQTGATDTAEVHALSARQAAHSTTVLKMFILMRALLRRNNSCSPKRIVMNEHAGLHMHAAQITYLCVQRTEMESRNKPSHRYDKTNKGLLYFKGSLLMQRITSIRV